MRRVLLACGRTVWVSWLSARLGVEVRHTCDGQSRDKHSEHVSEIVRVLEAPAGAVDNAGSGKGQRRPVPAVHPKRVAPLEVMLRRGTG